MSLANGVRRLETEIMPELISLGYKENTIYNFDETGLLITMNLNKRYRLKTRK